MNKRLYFWGTVLVLAAAAWIGRMAYAASKNLVTLDVRDAEVRDVVKKCEWQTWETIVVDKDVKGKVTLNVTRMPLEQVMTIIGDQTSSRFSAVYPIFPNSKSVVNLRKLARGDIEKEGSGWTNYNTGNRGGFGGFGGFGGRGGGGPGGPGGPGGFGEVKSQDAPVSLNVQGKDLGFAALALSRFAQSQVVPADGVNAVLNLQLAQVPFTDAVSAVAKVANCKWEVFYTLQAQPDFFGRRDDGDRGDRGDRGGFGRFNRGEGDTNRQFRAEDRDAQRQREMEARLATMTAEDQAKEKERQQTFEQMRDMTPEQRQQAFQEMQNSPQFAQERARMEQRMENNFKYSTPEQRVDRLRRMNEMRKRRDQGGGRN